jgi:hypothetical protein
MMSNGQSGGGAGIGCAIWLAVGGICAVVGLPAIIVLLVIAVPVGAVCGVLNLMNSGD